ncbi:M48 family metalloprotease [Saccharothrix obliqua]|uniref:M48 family metalloprotease n=1 Tax=Saccharothrix obliqua TaxID=2861747 RepID=UPI001C5F7EE6|nr:M48 family metalloprotease [Saccharothrix obliqua]MBW4717280.1 M48 family metalloprotease [Saccharothrix obliqua]
MAPRIDERVLGPGTTVRFTLLLVLLAVASVVAASDFASWWGESDPWSCWLATGWDPDREDLAVLGSRLGQAGPLEACLARYAPPPPWWLPLLGPLVLTAVAAGLFFGTTARKARRLVPVTRIDHDGDLTAALDDLVVTAGLPAAPAFAVDPTATSTGAVVFGRNRKPVVSLHIGLLVRRPADPAGFRAVVLHELAHIRNRDVSLTGATVALWRAFLVLVLLPKVLWLGTRFVDGPDSPLWSSYLPGLARDIVLAVVLVLLVHLARADVLRTREVHADLTALRWGADRRGWDTADTGPLGAFAELWRTHPRGDLRRASLDDPAPLFGVRALPMFLTGVGAALINNSVWQYLKDYRIAGWWVDQFVALLAAGLVTGVVGIALWRAVVHARLTGITAPSGVRAGLWLGAGVLAGELVTGQNVVHDWVPGRWWLLSVVVVAGVGFAWWIARCARLWAGTWSGRTLRLPMLLVLAAGCVVLSTWFAWWLGGGAVLVVGWPIGTDAMVAEFQRRIPGVGPPWLVEVVVANVPLIASVTKVPLLLVAVALAWVVPLLAWTVRPATLRWVREADPDLPDPPPRPLPRLRRVVTPGLLAGAVAAGVLVVGRDLPELGFMAATFAAVTAAALLAAITAPGRHHLPVLLTAAQVAALTTLATAVVLRSWPVLGPIVVPSLVSAAVVGAAVAAVRAATRRRPAPAPTHPVSTAPRRVAVAVLAAAALLVSGAEVMRGAAVPSGEGDLGPAPEAASAPSARTTRLQLAAWTRVGGRAVLGHVTGAATCADISAAARETDAFFRVPDRRLRPLWDAVVMRADRARTNCATDPGTGLAWARRAADAATALRTGLDAVARGDEPVVAVPGLGDALAPAQWADRGARDLLARFDTAAQRLFAYIEEVRGKVETTALMPHCAEVTEVAKDARDFFPVDDPWMQERWEGFVRSAAKAGLGCAQSLVDLDEDALRAALEEIERLQDVVVCLENRVGDVTGDSC